MPELPKLDDPDFWIGRGCVMLLGLFVAVLAVVARGNVCQCSQFHAWRSGKYAESGEYDAVQNRLEKGMLLSGRYEAYKGGA